MNLFNRYWRVILLSSLALLIAAQALSLPSSVDLTEADQARVIAAMVQP